MDAGCVSMVGNTIGAFHRDDTSSPVIGVVTVELVAPADYQVIVTGTCGDSNSDVAILEVLNKTEIIIGDLSDEIGCEGEAVTFAVAAVGDSLTYQWRKDGVDVEGADMSSLTFDPVVAEDAGSWVHDGAAIPGATLPTLTLFEVTIDDLGLYECHVTNLCGTVESEAGDLTRLSDEECGQSFVRGDVNDDGRFNLADPISLLKYLFNEGAGTCLLSMDANDDERANIADAIWGLNYLFQEGPEPKAPFPDCGIDPTVPENGELDCELYEGCED